MAGYDIFLSNGKQLTTIEPKTIDRRASSSLLLIGQGVPSEWQTIDQNLVWLLENFSKSSPPPKPLMGQKWHDKRDDHMKVYTGQVWHSLVTAGMTADAEFDMLASSRNIDFTVADSVPIFMAPDPTKAYLPTSLLLVPSGPITAETPPTIAVSAMTAEDILSSTPIPIRRDGKFARLPITGATRMISGGPFDNPYGIGHYGIDPYANAGPRSVARINITTAATGGQLRYDAHLYGFVVENPTLMPLPSEDFFGIGLYGRGPYSYDGD